MSHSGRSVFRTPLAHLVEARQDCVHHCTCSQRKNREEHLRSNTKGMISMTSSSQYADAVPSSGYAPQDNFTTGELELICLVLDAMNSETYYSAVWFHVGMEAKSGGAALNGLSEMRRVIRAVVGYDEDKTGMDRYPNISSIVHAGAPFATWVRLLRDCGALSDVMLNDLVSKVKQRNQRILVQQARSV